MEPIRFELYVNFPPGSALQRFSPLGATPTPAKDDYAAQTPPQARETGGPQRRPIPRRVAEPVA